MGTVLNSLFGKGKGNYGDVEYWHGAERAGWLMKQGNAADYILDESALQFADPQRAASTSFACGVKACTSVWIAICLTGAFSVAPARRVRQDVAAQASSKRRIHHPANLSTFGAAGRP